MLIKMLQKLIILLLLWRSCSSFNIDVKEAVTLFLRHGGSSASSTDDEASVPAYAGYSFDARRDGDSIRLLVGQPKAGIANVTEYPGALYSCDFSFKTTNATSKLLCEEIPVFQQSQRSDRGTDHERYADAIGLNLHRISDSKYAICTPLRQRLCPTNTAYVPGACYCGSPTDKSWTFLKWNEAECMDGVIDIIFVVDGSKSIKKVNFEIVKDWLINVTTALIEQFGDAVRTEVMEFADKDPLGHRIKIEDSKKFEIPYTFNEGLTVEEIRQKISNMIYLNGGTETQFALDRATKVEFKDSDRYDVSHKVLVLLTDGQARVSTLLKSWYTKNHKTVTPFAIGVGDNIDEEELRIIANGGTSEARVLKIDSFNELSAMAKNLISAAVTGFVEGTKQSSDKNAGDDRSSPRLGTAISSTQDGKLLFGATGMYFGTGVVMEFYDKSDTNPLAQSFREMQDFLPNRTEDSYFGYSIVTGFFDGESALEMIAVGAPRFKLVGAVVMYLSNNTDSPYRDPFRLLPPINWRRVGSYFGSHLLSLDVNGDGKDDLLIASPLYVGNFGSNDEGGRVFAYISQESGNSAQIWADEGYTPKELAGDNTINNRFGMAMADAGDLNKDGFNDVVIGAPLADEGRGIVFVYHGERNGIKEKFCQKIHASDIIGQSLSYFGLSLQGNVDLDNNQYPDVVVGAPRSDSVVILRTRPVVKIEGSLNFSRTTINIFECIKSNSQNCTSITACFKASGTAVEQIIGIDFKLTLDTEKKRNFEKRLYVSSENPNWGKATIIPSENETCFTENVHYRSLPEIDFDTPLTVVLDFDLSHSHKTTPLSSVLSIDTVKLMTAEAMFSTKCRNRACVPGLHLTAEMDLPPFSNEAGEDFTRNGDVFILTSSNARNPLAMRINVTNSGDNSFDTGMNISYPAVLSLGPASKISSSTSSRSCMVGIGAPTSEESSVTSEFRFDFPEGIMWGQSWCYFKFIVTTDGLRDNGILEEFTININVFSKSVISVENNTSDNQWNTSKKIKYVSGVRAASEQGRRKLIVFNETTETHNITSVVEIGLNTSDIIMGLRVDGTGYSNIPLSELTLTYPSIMENGLPILYLFKIECESYQRAVCQCNDSSVNRYNLTLNKEMNSSSNQFTIEPAMNTIEWTQLSCLNNDPNSTHLCESIKCDISNLGERESVRFFSHFRLWTASIVINETEHAQIISTFEYSTARSPLIITETGKDVITYQTEFVTEVKKYQIPRNNPERNQTWIFIVSLAGGLLLLAIMVVVLWKCGFFKDSQWKKKLEEEEQQKLKEETEFHERSASEEGWQDELLKDAPNKD